MRRKRQAISPGRGTNSPRSREQPKKKGRSPGPFSNQQLIRRNSGAMAPLELELQAVRCRPLTLLVDDRDRSAGEAVRHPRVDDVVVVDPELRGLAADQDGRRSDEVLPEDRDLLARARGLRLKAGDDRRALVLLAGRGRSGGTGRARRFQRDRALDRAL